MTRYPWRNDPRKPRTRSREEPETERALIPLPADTLQDKDVLVASEVERHHWLDEIYTDFERKGGYDRLPGKGKPLKVPDGDLVATLLRNANVTHPWIELQRLIRELIEDTLRLVERNPDDPAIDEQLADINKKIVQMNLGAPSLTLHKRKITRDNIREELAKWK